MKNISIGILFTFLLTTVGCQMNESPDPTEPIVEPRFAILVESDTITAGSYLGLNVTETAETSYSKIQSLAFRKKSLM